MGEVTHEQVNLMLRLYDMRREQKLREAREWCFANFHPASMEEMAKVAPMGSKENAFVRMVITYWEMVAGIVNRGLIDEEFFFENSGEQWFVFEAIKPVLGEMRAAYKNPHQFGQLEIHVKRMEAWRDKRSPGSSEAMRQMIAQRGQAAAPKAKSA